MDELGEKFRSFKLEVLEDIVRNQKSEYTEEAYNIAVDELRLQTSEEYVDSLLSDAAVIEAEKIRQEKLKQEKVKKISLFFQRVLLGLLLLIFIGINIGGCCAFFKTLIENDMSFLKAEQNRVRELEEMELRQSRLYPSTAPLGYYPLEYDPYMDRFLSAERSIKALCVFPIISLLVIVMLVLFRKKSNMVRCCLIGSCLLLEIGMYLRIVKCLI